MRPDLAYVAYVREVRIRKIVLNGAKSFKEARKLVKSKILTKETLDRIVFDPEQKDE